MQDEAEDEGHQAAEEGQVAVAEEDGQPVETKYDDNTIR